MKLKTEVNTGNTKAAAIDANNDMPFAGLDIFTKICNLIRGTTEIPTPTPSLKRRADDPYEHNQLTKYRRVNNEFPKIITKPFEDDLCIVKSSNNYHRQAPPKISVIKRRNYNPQYPYNISQSNFMTNFADLEYSDDDFEIDLTPQLYCNNNRPLASSSFNSPDLISNISTRQQSGGYQRIQTNDSSNNLRIVNVPIKILENKKPIPGLIEARTGHIYNTNYIPNLRPIRKSNKYALPTIHHQQQQPQYQHYVNGNTPSTSYANNQHHPNYNHIIDIDNDENQIQKNNHSGGSVGFNLNSNNHSERPAHRKTAAAATILNSDKKYSANSNILAHVYNVKERHTYEELLRRLVPSLYKKREGFPIFSSIMKNVLPQKQPSDTQATAVNENIDLTDNELQTTSSQSKVINLDDDDYEDDANGTNGTNGANGGGGGDSDTIGINGGEASCSSSSDRRTTNNSTAVNGTVNENHEINLDDDDDDDIEFVQLNEDEYKIVRPGGDNIKNSKNIYVHQKKNEQQTLIKKPILPKIEPVNSLKEKQRKPIYDPKWLENFKQKCIDKQKDRTRKIQETFEDLQKQTMETERLERILERKMRNFVISPQYPIIDETEDVEEEVEFPELTPEDIAVIKNSLYHGSTDQVLVVKFNMNITRHDIQTLKGDSWLNDEVINFYMNLLMERSDKRSDDGYPKVYAMNTFFLPRLLSSGHSGVRRWTRKVDIFQYDIIPIPVHVGGVHWCMAIVHLKNKTIQYYDSMGSPNQHVLQIIEQYLREESLDKKKIEFDTSGFEKVSVPDCPRQMNGSDCGVFSCMFAEYICRDRPITFSQQNMNYFRQKMVLEIVQGKLMM